MTSNDLLRRRLHAQPLTEPTASTVTEAVDHFGALQPQDRGQSL